MFRNSPTGDIVPISGTSDRGKWEHIAFVPHPLGESTPDLDASTYMAVAQARASLAALDATAARLPNPRLFRQAVLRVEAQATAAIEGTYEPLAQVLGNDDSDEHDPSLREVLNYVIVAEAAFSWADEGRRLTLSSIGELHRMLMEGTVNEREYFGIRPIQVVVGRRESASVDSQPITAARYVPPPPGDLLAARVSDLLDWMQTSHDGSIDPVVASAMGHYGFEALHPFHDGNGRLGRLFVVVQLQALGVLTEPTISVSPWFEARRQQYYDALLGVSTTGDWSTWITMFAQGLTQSADDTKQRMLALADAQSAMKDRLQQSRVRTANARVLVDFAVERPTFTVAQAAEAIGLKYQGTTKLISLLVDLGILAEYGNRSYNRRFHAPLVWDILLGRSAAS